MTSSSLDIIRSLCNNASATAFLTSGGDFPGQVPCTWKMHLLFQISLASRDLLAARKRGPRPPLRSVCRCRMRSVIPRRLGMLA